MYAVACRLLLVVFMLCWYCLLLVAYCMLDSRYVPVTCYLGQADVKHAHSHKCCMLTTAPFGFLQYVAPWCQSTIITIRAAHPQSTRVSTVSYEAAARKLHIQHGDGLYTSHWGSLKLSLGLRYWCCSATGDSRIKAVLHGELRRV